MFNKKISVIGLGYIGLPTAAMFASKKQNVIGVDVNENIVSTINSGHVHILEEGLAELVQNVVKKGNLKAKSKLETSDAFIIAVPTPFKTNTDDQYEPDLSYVMNAGSQIAPILKKGDLIILESTSPVGTTFKLSNLLSEARPDLTFPHKSGNNADIYIAYCPERVLPGKIIIELCKNDRIIGGLSSNSAEKAKELYKIFVNGDCILTNAETAEMVKLTENSARDVQIAFANEISIICDKLDINTSELIALANRHPRINILQPGPGVGGHCIAVDPWFIVHKTPEEAKLIKLARENLTRNINDITIACYGLSYKPDIDDFRESPALYIVSELLQIYPGQVVVVEPNMNENIANKNKITLTTINQASQKADIHVFLVAHSDFKDIKLNMNYLVDSVGFIQT